MLTAISPIDGRYEGETEALRAFFSEYALIRYRLKVEIEYLIALSEEPTIPEIPEFTSHNKQQLRLFYKNFSLKNAERVKVIEATTKHDVKAVEYFIREKLTHTPLASYIPFIHFALTSEDVNNIAHTLMWRDALYRIVLPELQTLFEIIEIFASLHKDLTILSLTHGQPASPTTLGKEYAVFYKRLEGQIIQLQHHHFKAKLNGATGTWAAHELAFPLCNWMRFSERFMDRFGLEHNGYTTQVEPRDLLIGSYHILFRIQSILLDMCKDTWMYTSRGLLQQKNMPHEVGSSTMPHKINPIHFENAEGNLGIAQSLLHHLSEKLPISRMQRDLSCSTVLRNQGVTLAHHMLAVKQIIKGMQRIEPNKEVCAQELNNHWEVLTEAIQTMLRKAGSADAYEQVKKLTRGTHLAKEEYIALVKSLELSGHDKEKLLALTPQTYIGYAPRLIDMM